MVRETQSGEGVSVELDGAGLEEMSPEPLLTRDYETRPSLVYERLRQRHGAVAPVDLLGVPAWLVLGYRELHQVTSDPELFSRDSGLWNQWPNIPVDWPLLPVISREQPSILGSVGARHRRRAALDAADLRVLAVGREHRVGGAQVGERARGGLLRGVTAGLLAPRVDADRHAHDLLDPHLAGAGGGFLTQGRDGVGDRRRGLGAHRPAWSSALCSDWA